MLSGAAHSSAHAAISCVMMVGWGCRAAATVHTRQVIAWRFFCKSSTLISCFTSWSGLYGRGMNWYRWMTGKKRIFLVSGDVRRLILVTRSILKGWFVQPWLRVRPNRTIFFVTYEILSNLENITNGKKATAQLEWWLHHNIVLYQFADFYQQVNVKSGRVAHWQRTCLLRW